MHTLIDCGANLTSEQFEADREQVIQRARAAGIDAIICIGCDVESSRRSLGLARQHDDYVYATAGIHPHYTDGAEPSALPALRRLLEDPRVIAVGETGLDFNRNYSTPDNQRRIFAAQLEIAAEAGKPVYLHQRDAFREQLAILRGCREQLPGGLAHCFTNDREQARAWLDLGLHIGITGWLCDPRRGEQLRDAVRYIPLERLVLETDAPYLVPRHASAASLGVPVKRRNEPFLLPAIAGYLADILQCTPGELARITAGNARSLFGLPACNGETGGIDH